MKMDRHHRRLPNFNQGSRISNWHINILAFILQFPLQFHRAQAFNFCARTFQIESLTLIDKGVPGMKRILAVFALLAFNAHAQVHKLELKNYPDLKTYHECKDTDGKIRRTADPCESWETLEDQFKAPKDAHDELDDLVKNRPDLKAKLDKLDQEDNASATKKSTKENKSESEKQTEEKQLNKQWRKSMMKLIGFAVLLGLLAKLIGRSFIRWFIVGIVAHFLLVALNVISL